jgi:hypothetical protein
MTSNYPQTGSTLYSATGNLNTRTAISTNILIKVGPSTVGAIQTINVDEERKISMIDEVGTDGHIDGVPSASTNISGSCKRIRFDRMRIAEAFSRGFVHTHSQRFPFDIVIIDNWNGAGNASIVTVLEGVWISKISYAYGKDDWVISDDMTWQAQTTSSTLANGPAATGGDRNIPLAIDPIEQAADIGQRRGSLDYPGLLSSFLPY